MTRKECRVAAAQERETLARLGVRYAVISPGSRSTPLTPGRQKSSSAVFMDRFSGPLLLDGYERLPAWRKHERTTKLSVQKAVAIGDSRRRPMGL